MRLKKVTLREIHLPLISPFQTSFGTTTLRRILLVEADVDGVFGLGRIDRRRRSLLLLRDCRNRLAHPARLPLAHAEGQGIRAGGGSLRSLLAGPRPQHGEGGDSKPPSGTPKQAEKCAAGQTARRSARRKFPAAFPSASSRRFRSCSRKSKRNCRRLPAHQNQDQAGQGRRAWSRAARKISAHPADGGRQLRLHAWRTRRCSKRSTRTT